MGQDSADACNRRDGRIVRVDRQLHAGLLSHRDRSAQKVLQRLPQAVLADNPCPCERCSFHELMLVAGGQGIATDTGGERSTQPGVYRHPVVTHDRNARGANVAQGCTPLLNGLVAASESQLDHLRRLEALDHGPLEAGILDPLPLNDEVTVFPDGTGAGRSLECGNNVGASDLACEFQITLGDVREHDAYAHGYPFPG